MNNLLAHPAGIAKPPKGLFCLRFPFFQLSHHSFDNGWTNSNADCCVNTAGEKFIWLKFGKLRSRDIAMATNFVARNGDKLALNALLYVLAFYNGWEDRKTYTNT